MNSTKTLPREPWRGSQICGWQTEYGNGRGERYCAARKADGLYMCQEHHDAELEALGRVFMAPGNALGDLSVPVRLLWEPYDGILPVVPTDEEQARYAGILGLV